MTVPRIRVPDAEPPMLAGDDVPKLVWVGIWLVAACAFFMLLMAALS